MDQNSRRPNPLKDPVVWAVVSAGALFLAWQLGWIFPRAPRPPVAAPVSVSPAPRASGAPVVPNHEIKREVAPVAESEPVPYVSAPPPPPVSAAPQPSPSPRLRGAMPRYISPQQERSMGAGQRSSVTTVGSARRPNEAEAQKEAGSAKRHVKAPLSRDEQAALDAEGLKSRQKEKGRHSHP